MARNRAAILNAAIETMAENGSQTAVDQVAERADVALSTVYKHFKNRDELFVSAMSAAMSDWEGWAFQIISTSEDPLEQLVLPMRLLARLRSTHPLYAQLIEKNIAFSAAHNPLFSGFEGHVKSLIRAGVLKLDHPDIRIQNFQGLLFQAISNQITNPKASPQDADLAIEIGLSLLNITPAKARKLTQSKLPIRQYQ